MPVKTFDEIVSGLSAQEKSLLDNLFAKEPELKNGWLRQDDYSRRQTELKTELEKAQEAIDYKAKMEPWAATAYERIHSLEEAGVIDDEGKVLWVDQKTQLENELKAAREAAIAGGEMKPEDVEKTVLKIIKDAGPGLTKEEISALMANETKKAVEDGFKEREAKFNSETIPFVAGFSTAAAIVAAHYEAESGEKWNADKQKEMYDLMSAEKNFDPFKVEEKLLAPIRAKKSEEERIQKAVDERLKNMGLPGSGTERIIPQSQEVGALQAAMQSKDSGMDLEQLIKSKAVEASQELVQSGKF